MTVADRDSLVVEVDRVLHAVAVDVEVDDAAERALGEVDDVLRVHDRGQHGDEQEAERWAGDHGDTLFVNGRNRIPADSGVA